MRKVLRSLVVVALFSAAILVTSAGPAFTEDRGPVPNHAIVGTVDLFGMQEAEARAAISREASVTLLPRLSVTAAGVAFSLEASRCLRLNVDAMLAKAYAASTETTFTIPRSCVVSSTLVAAFVNRVAVRIQRAPRSASYYVNRYGRLSWRTAIYGRSLYKSAAISAITRSLAIEAASGTARPRLTLTYASARPAVTNATLGRAILVDLSQRRLSLYDHWTILKSYGVAVGMPTYPTPRGTFRIVAKRMYPSWGNPGSSWAAGMPAYIPPGPNNPLGTRALYLSVSGIRIHGTSQWWSIGHAASHGCIRLTNHNVEILYPMVSVGTKVFVVP